MSIEIMRILLTFCIYNLTNYSSTHTFMQTCLTNLPLLKLCYFSNIYIFYKIIYYFYKLYIRAKVITTIYYIVRDSSTKIEYALNISNHVISSKRRDTARVFKLLQQIYHLSYMLFLLYMHTSCRYFEQYSIDWQRQKLYCSKSIALSLPTHTVSVSILLYLIQYQQIDCYKVCLYTSSIRLLLHYIISLYFYSC